MSKLFSWRYASLILVVILAIFAVPIQPARAAASLYATINKSASVVNDVLVVSVSVDTGGSNDNAFEADLSYSEALVSPIDSSTAGSICNIWVSNGNPASGTAYISCGNSSGYSGTGRIINVRFTATAPGTANFGLSNCSVLKNDGLGTSDTGSCTGTSSSITGAPIPTPTPTPGPTPVPTPTKVPSTPKSTITPKPGTTVPPTTPVPLEKPKEAPAASNPPVPDEKKLPASTPTPVSATPTPEPTVPEQKRSIATAFSDLLKNLKSFKLTGKDSSGLVAILLTLIPFMLLLLAVVYFIYRLYLLERRRRRTLDRLFELELSELSALEGKMDLLAEKGSKGRAQYREEFKKSKESILRQLRPDYAKPIDSKKPEEPTKPAEPGNPPS